MYAFEMVLILLVLFDTFQISGISLVSIGIWFKVDPDILEYINVSLTTDEAYIMTAANILIAFGAIVFTIAFCGCFGTLCNSRFLLGIVSYIANVYLFQYTSVHEKYIYIFVLADQYNPTTQMCFEDFLRRLSLHSSFLHY